MRNPAELILNDRGAIYHLDLMPHEVAPTIITVGDPQRVAQVSQFFDHIDFIKTHREFVTHTGVLRGIPISAISTGMGAENIDIFMNELDAVFNIDFNTNAPKKKFTSLNIIRIGTSGTFHPNININEYVINSHAIGFDATLVAYVSLDFISTELAKSISEVTPLAPQYISAADLSLLNIFKEIGHTGVTLTMPGFYAPQGRQLRLANKYSFDFEKLHKIKINDIALTNIEMETAAIYKFAELMGHKAISINAILAHRVKNIFSQDANSTINKLIVKVLALI